MKIKIKLSLQYSLIVTTILLLFSSGIYFFSAKYRANEFEKKLTNRAITIARLMIVVPDTNSTLFDKINKNTVNLLYKENLFIYNYKSFALLYSAYNDSSAYKYDNSFLNEIKKNGYASYSKDERETIGITYPETNPQYIAITSAIDMYGINVLKNLRFILIGVLLLSLLLVIITAFIFANEAIKPISIIIGQIDKITASQLHSRVIVEENKDEISTLAQKFNNMLDRLEEAFIMQKNFVSNASHELRTPLTSIKGQIDVALLRSRNLDEYISILDSINTDISILTTLTNGFLEMAESGMDNHHLKKDKIRVDELLFNVQNEFRRNNNNNYTINISFENTVDDEMKLIIPANLSLMKILFHNLIDNACKFSNDKTVNIIISPSERKKLVLFFIDKGIGIPEDEINKITEPFYRASNVSGKNGYGIGLSIAKQIVSLHNGEIDILSELNKGTTIKLTFLY